MSTEIPFRNYCLFSHVKPSYYHLPLVWLSLCKVLLLPVSASLPLVCVECSSGWCTFLTASPLELPLTPFLEWGKWKILHILKIVPLFKNKTKHGHWQFIGWYEPFPVKYFRKWQNVGVSQDYRDTTSLQHVTEGSLAQTSPPQHHTEWGFLYVHNGSVKTT